MLNDIALRVGETLTSSVNVPFRDTRKPASRANWSKLFGLPMQIVKLVRKELHNRALDRELVALPGTVLDDLGLEGRQLRARVEADYLAEGVYQQQATLDIRNYR